MASSSPVKAKAAFFAQYPQAPQQVQTAVNAELLVIASSAGRQGSIYAASWDDPVRWVVVATNYGLYWRDYGNGDYEVLALIALPAKLLI